MRFLSLWGPVIAVMTVIFTASSMSDPGAPPGGLSDKTAHFAAYAALFAGCAVLAARGLPPRPAPAGAAEPSRRGTSDPRGRPV